MGDAANIICIAALALFGYLVAPERMRPPHIVYHGDVKFLVHRHTILGATHSHNPHDLHFSGWAVQAAASYMRPGSKVAFVAGVGDITRFEAQAFHVLIGGQTQTISPEGQPRFHAMYEIESPNVLSSPEWGEAVELGRWPEQVRPHTTNRRHTLLRLTYPEV